MGGLVDMDKKGFESTGCRTHCVTWIYDLDLGFLRSNFEIVVSEKWEGWLISTLHEIPTQALVNTFDYKSTLVQVMTWCHQAIPEPMLTQIYVAILHHPATMS